MPAIVNFARRKTKPGARALIVDVGESHEVKIFITPRARALRSESVTGRFGWPGCMRNFGNYVAGYFFPELQWGECLACGEHKKLTSVGTVRTKKSER